MKRNFPGYYALSPQAKGSLSRFAVFTLDANVLLNVYSLGSESRDAFLGLLGQLADQHRIWLTHQAGLEFQQSRPSKVMEQLKPSKKVKAALNQASESIESEIGQLEDHPFIDSTQIREKVNRLTNEIIAELEQQEQEFSKKLQNDEIRDRLDDIFLDAVGPSYTNGELDQIFKDGRIRYKRRIPPGFGDSKEYGGKKDEPECYGDLVLWKQIIDHSREVDRPIVLITEDHQKADWYWMVDPNKKGSKLLGPHPGLVEEMLEATGKRFHVGRTAVFAKWMSRYLGRTVAPQLIEEIEEASASPLTMRDFMTATGEWVLRTQRGLQNIANWLDTSGVLKAIEAQQRMLVRSTTSHVTSAVDDLVQSVRKSGVQETVEELSRAISSKLLVSPRVLLPEFPAARPTGTDDVNADPADE